MKLLNNILSLFWIQRIERGISKFSSEADQFIKENRDILTEAIEYYCPLCKKGFEKRVGKLTHMRFKHKDDNN